jgi:hypothetical protein
VYLWEQPPLQLLMIKVQVSWCLEAGHVHTTLTIHDDDEYLNLCFASVLTAHLHGQLLQCQVTMTNPATRERCIGGVIQLNQSSETICLQLLCMLVWQVRLITTTRQCGSSQPFRSPPFIGDSVQTSC